MGQYVPPQGSSPSHPSQSHPSPAASGANPRFARQQEKVLAKLQPLLDRVLEQGEKVLVASRAVAPYTFVELMTTGWVVQIVKRAVLVFTDRRILHVPTTSGFASRESVAEIRYADIAELSFSSFLGSAVKLLYRNGKKEKFTAIARKELKAIREHVPALVGTGTMTPEAGRRHLCPRCKVALQAGRFDCPGCGLQFKSRQKAVRLSLLAPGGGYFYTRHPVMGVLDALVELYLIILLFIGVALAFTGETADDVAAGWMFIVLFGIILAIEKAITIYHAGHYVKEYLPVEMRIAAAPAMA